MQLCYCSLWCCNSAVGADQRLQHWGPAVHSLTLQQCDLLPECWRGRILRLGVVQQTQGMTPCCSFASSLMKPLQIVLTEWWIHPLFLASMCPIKCTRPATYLPQPHVLPLSPASPWSLCPAPSFRVA